MSAVQFRTDPLSAIATLAVLGVAGFLVYKGYKAGSAVVSGVEDTAKKIGDAAQAIADKGGEAFNAAYQEAKNAAKPLPDIVWNRVKDTDTVFSAAKPPALIGLDLITTLAGKVSDATVKFFRPEDYVEKIGEIEGNQFFDNGTRIDAEGNYWFDGKLVYQSPRVSYGVIDYSNTPWKPQ